DKTNDPTQAITRRQLLRGIVGSAGVVALAAAGCASPATSPTAATTAPVPAATTAPAVAATQAPAAVAGTPSAIKLGAMFSMSGQSAAVAKPQMFGARLATQDINAKGGIKYKGQQIKIELVERDDESKPEIGVQRYRQLVTDDKVTLMVGGTSANVPAAINEEMKKTTGMFITANGLAIATFKKATKSPYLMQMPMSTYATGRVTARVIGEFKPKTVVLFLPDYAYGQDVNTAVREVLPVKNPEIKFETVFHPQGATDVSSYVQKIAEMKPDMTFFGQWGNDGVVALKQAYEGGLFKKTKVFFIHLGASFATAIPAEAMEQVEAHMFFYHNLTGLGEAASEKTGNDFTTKYRALANEYPDTYSPTAYMGITELVRGIELSNSLDPGEVYGALQKNPEIGNSVRGPGSWRKDGQVAWKYIFFRVKGRGPKDRPDPKWDFAQVTGGTPDGGATPTEAEMGY
ncbi:MAG: ABC transporter substrate-binding protein, partial [Chloroflexota bacterium]